MKTSISKFLLFLISLLLVLSLSLLLVVPKAILLDKLLSERGIHLLAGRVDEGVADVSFEKLRVFYGGEEVLDLDRAVLSFSPAGLKAEGRCGSGRAYLRLGWGKTLEIKLRDFACSPFFRSASAKLLVSEGLHGKLKISGLRVRGVEIDSVSMSFKGETFDGSISYMGMTLSGGGRFRLRRSIRRSPVDAIFKGKMGTLLVKGTLSNISVQLK